MTNRLGLFLLMILGFGLSAPAPAANVSVGGRVWRQLTETSNFSWNQVSTVCNSASGSCSGSIGSVSLSGWVWASNSEVRAVFEALILPGSVQFTTSTTNYFATNGPDINAAISTSRFVPTYVDGNQGFVGGWSRTPVSSSPSSAYVPALQNFFAAAGQDGALLSPSTSKSEPSTTRGVWLYEATPVPLRAAGRPLASGFGGIAALTRRRKATSNK